jgi:hypothetical protein
LAESKVIFKKIEELYFKRSLIALNGTQTEALKIGLNKQFSDIAEVMKI